MKYGIKIHAIINVHLIFIMNGICTIFEDMEYVFCKRSWVLLIIVTAIKGHYQAFNRFPKPWLVKVILQATVT